MAFVVESVELNTLKKHGSPLRVLYFKRKGEAVSRPP